MTSTVASVPAVEAGRQSEASTTCTDTGFGPIVPAEPTADSAAFTRRSPTAAPQNDHELPERLQVAGLLTPGTAAVKARASQFVPV